MIYNTQKTMIIYEQNLGVSIDDTHDKIHDRKWNLDEIEIWINVRIVCEKTWHGVVS